jgi:hypothetical protein
MKFAVLLVVASSCFGQAAPTCVSAVSFWYLNLGQSPFDPLIKGDTDAVPPIPEQYKWAYLKSPLTGCFDASGTLQIGATITTGPAGAAGATGQQGNAGPAGVTGAPGVSGQQGAPGTEGQQGASGAAGVAGSTGPPGPAGAPGTLTIESGGVALPGVATTLDIEPGIGVLCVPQLDPTAGVLTLQCHIDTAVVAYRVDPPSASGPCVDPATNLPYGAGAWAADGSFLYTCVPGAAGLVWARSVLATSW